MWLIYKPQSGKQDNESTMREQVRGCLRVNGQTIQQVPLTRIAKWTEIENDLNCKYLPLHELGAWVGS